MGFKLIGSNTSPYVRKLRVYMLEENIPFEFQNINIFEKEGADYLKKISPINKIPVLLENEKPVWDSRVIFNYLQQKYKKAPLAIEEENILSAIDAGFDANIIRLLSQRSGLEMDSDLMILKRNKHRTTEILDFVSPYAAKWVSQNTWNFLSISLYCLLEWLEFRKLYEFNDKKELVAFYKHFQSKESIKTTRPQ